MTELEPIIREEVAAAIGEDCAGIVDQVESEVKARFNVRFDRHQQNLNDLQKRMQRVERYVGLTPSGGVSAEDMTRHEPPPPTMREDLRELDLMLRFLPGGKRGRAVMALERIARRMGVS